MFLGASAIEDALQDQVPEVIQSLRDAGIIVWMLTGDKLETALQISHSCKLITNPHMTSILHIKTPSSGVSMAIQVAELKQSIIDCLRDARLAHDAKREVCLVVQGNSLSVLFSAEATSNSNNGDNTNLLSLFVDLADYCKSVVCCRMNPMQKGQIVKCMKGGIRLNSSSDSTASNNENSQQGYDSHNNSAGNCVSKLLSVVWYYVKLSVQTVFALVLNLLSCFFSGCFNQCFGVNIVPRKRTLAIGDGGNDVAMLHEADVGVGISGREGLQAVRAADYGIAEFKYLKRLVLVHGVNSHRRMSQMIHYVLYKAWLIAISQLMFAGFSFFSGAPILDSFVLTTYNTVFTLFLPVSSHQQLIETSIPNTNLFNV